MPRHLIALLTGLLLFSLAPQMVQGQTQASEIEVALLPITGPVIDNFALVSNQLYRGAAPSDLAIHHLSGQGIKTIIDLRMNGDGCRHEQALADHLGIHYVHIPMGLTRPTITQIVTFLRVVNNEQNQPIYVHCRYGADRTGMLIGIYRILVQHWSYAKVYGEMREHHFKPWLASMKRTVELVAESPSAQQTLRNLMTDPNEQKAFATAYGMRELAQ
jgi:protein tyrosine phosphatase (PTP) superfamily phosphohydrolase (DUF442 family)